MTGGIRRRWRGLRLSRAVQAEKHRHHQARGAHGPCHPSGRGSRGARESGSGDESSPRTHGKPRKTWSEEERETCSYPAAAKVSSQLPGRWARAGMFSSAGGAGRGQPGRGGAGRGGTGRGGAGRGQLRGLGETVSLRARDAGPRGLLEHRNVGTNGGGSRGECAMAPGSPTPLPVRRRSTQGALAQLLQRGCRLGSADWLPSSRPL